MPCQQLITVKCFSFQIVSVGRHFYSSQGRQKVSVADDVGRAAVHRHEELHETAAKKERRHLKTLRATRRKRLYPLSIVEGDIFLLHETVAVALAEADETKAGHEPAVAAQIFGQGNVWTFQMQTIQSGKKDGFFHSR